MTLLSLTQVSIWVLGAGAAIGLALSSQTNMPSSLSIPWNAILWAVLLGAPGYFLYATLASGLGIISGDHQQARQLAGILGMLGSLPLYFIGILVNAIDGPLAVGLTLFPLTAPMIALFRMALSQVPVWQLMTSMVILRLSLVGSVWGVARIFRAAMLMYGQSLTPQQILKGHGGRRNAIWCLWDGHRRPATHHRHHARHVGIQRPGSCPGGPVAE